MAENTEIKVVVDEAALRAQVEEITYQVKQELVNKLLEAVELLNPGWLGDRDKLVADQAIAEYKAKAGKA